MGVHAIIFDMDGLLVNTESFWVQSQIEVLSRQGVPLTKSMCAQTTGLRIDEVVALWRERYPWSGNSIESLAFKIVTRVLELISEKGTLLPGAAESLTLAGGLDVPIALASSSPSRLIKHVLEHFNLKDYFSLWMSAEGLSYGKPHPEVYIQTASLLGAFPRSCIAIEDSYFGLLAAKSALMSAIVIPDSQFYSDVRWSIADHKLPSLLELRKEHFLC